MFAKCMYDAVNTIKLLGQSKCNREHLGKVIKNASARYNLSGKSNEHTIHDGNIH